MRIFDGQALGALMLLLGSIIIYGISLFNARQPIREASAIPWSHQGLGVVAVEVAAGGLLKQGIYFLPEGTTIGNLRDIGLAPGMHNMNGLEEVRIWTGMVLDISANGDVNIARMTDATRLALGLPLNLNYVSEGDLTMIPGIGEKMASQIIKLREQKGAFRDLSELMAIPGIKEKKLNVLREHLITAEEP